MTRKKTSGLLGVLLVLLLIGGVGVLGCSRASGEKDGEESAETADKDPSGDDKKEGAGEDGEDEEDQAVPVETTVLERGRIESVLSYSTNLEAESEVQVFSQAARQVRQLLVEEGDEVRRGQVLLRLQDEEQQTQLKRVESQLGNARREYDRQTRLYEQQLIPEQDFNDVTYELEQLELALEDAKRELSYAEVRAPISGTITARLVNLGDQVTLNQHLFDIVDFDSIVARVYVPEKQIVRVHPGIEARIRAQALGGEERVARVERVSPRVDSQSGTVKVTVEIPRNRELLPGMYVAVDLVTEIHENALLVPKKALVYDADQLFLFRVGDQDRVERLLIEAALEDPRYVEPVGGLEAGDEVVLAGQAALKDGSEVRRVGEPVPASTAVPEEPVPEEPVPEEPTPEEPTEAVEAP